MKKCTFQTAAIQLFDAEQEALTKTKALINEDFSRACKHILSCKGRVIVIGMGKSGHIGNKIAATFASTGTPSFFVHPAEASHGDLGMLTKSDVVLALSYSGNTPEVVSLMPQIKRLGTPIISITGNNTSMLAKNSDVSLIVDIDKEACPLNLAPTSSTTATLVLGDALAVALLEARGFKEEDFAVFHPGGTLGKRLLLRVSDVMHKESQIPLVPPETTIKDAVLEITDKRLGMTTVCDSAGKLLGIYTDGDLRRSFEHNADFYNDKIESAMSTTPKTIKENDLAAKGMQMMEEFKITAIVVVDNDKKVKGVLHLHALLESGIA